MAEFEIKDGVGIIPEGTTKIKNDAFKDRTDLKSIIIPDSVKEIGGCAFEGCTCLTDIFIPDSVTKIEVAAFEGCTSLQSVTIPDSVTEISSSVFKGCSSLTSIVISEGNEVYDSRNNCNAVIETETNTLVAGCAGTTIPKSVTKIGRIAFWERVGMTSIIIPKSVTEIGYSAFEGCKDLSEIVIPPSVTVIDHSLFRDCTNLTRVVLPKTVTKIKKMAFYGCTNLTEIVIPNSVTEIEDLAFCGCSSLTQIAVPKSLKTLNNIFCDCSALAKITIPKSVEEIGSHAFSGCCNLSELILPNSVRSIGGYVVYGCDKISHIDVPASVTMIDKDAFVGCENLTSIVVSKKNKFYDSRDNCNAIINKQKNELFIACAGTKMIPDTVTSIASQVFYNHTDLVSIEIPESVQTIGEEAFQECTSLETVIFKGTVKNIGEDVFDQCNHLKTIVVPDGQTDFYKERLDEALWDKIVESSQSSRKEGSEAAVSSRVYKTKGGHFTVSVGDVFARGEIYLDRDEYIDRYKYFSYDLYNVVGIYQKYLVVEGDAEGSKDSFITREPETFKLYPNHETDYFTTLPPAKFKKQWAYDLYYPRYYCLLSTDGSIRQPEPYSEEEIDKSAEDNDLKTFTIEGETWEEKKVIKTLEKQFKKLYPSRRLDVIEFEYEEGLEYYFNCLADDMNYQIMIDSETGNIHWDREL